MRQIVLDTETTGLRPDQGDRIVEIGCVEILNRRITGREYHCAINPEREMTEEVVKIHGLTNEFLRDKPVFAEVADGFCDFISGAELIIHNAPFDLGFINEEFRRLGRMPLEKVAANVVDTMDLAKKRFPNRSRPSLDMLCNLFKIDRSARVKHGALIDALLLAKVYLALTQGQESLMLEAGNPEAVARPNVRDRELRLFVRRASEEETASHEAYLDEMQEKLDGKPVVWRS